MSTWINNPIRVNGHPAILSSSQNMDMAWGGDMVQAIFHLTHDGHFEEGQLYLEAQLFKLSVLD